MIYTPLTNRAMQIAYHAHEGQYDVNGIPYVFHPYHLAEQMEDEITTAVALLHDVVEDTSYTLSDLRDMRFPDAVLDAITEMTHDKSVPYLEYVAKLKANPVARTVKLADLKHNSDLSRLDVVDRKALSRVEKYRKAISILEEE